MGISYNTSISRNGLIFCIDAANPKSYPGNGQIVKDISNSKKTMTLAAGVEFLPVNKGCFYHNASGDIGTSQAAYSGVVNSTWEAWINLEQSTNQFNMFMGRWSPYYSFFNGDRLYFSINTGGVQRVISTPVNKLPLTWYHTVTTIAYNGTNTTAKMYTNGVLDATLTWAGAPSYDGSVDIGDGRNTAWYPFKGKIAKAALYNRALTDIEVKQNFEALRGRYGI